MLGVRYFSQLNELKVTSADLVQHENIQFKSLICFFLDIRKRGWHRTILTRITKVRHSRLGSSKKKKKKALIRCCQFCSRSRQPGCMTTLEASTSFRCLLSRLALSLLRHTLLQTNTNFPSPFPSLVELNYLEHNLCGFTLAAASTYRHKTHFPKVNACGLQFRLLFPGRAQ